MAGYQRVLAAIDLSEEALPVIERAKSIAAQFSAQLHLLHVIEPLSLAYGGDIPMDFSSVQDQLQEQSEKTLGEYRQRFGVEEANCHLLMGRPESKVHELSEELDIDLVVVGSHGRKGLALLLGSTANGVLHGASCDVLAVRVG